MILALVIGALAWAAPTSLEHDALRQVYLHEDWPSAVLQARRVALVDADSVAAPLVLAAAYARTGRAGDAQGVLTPLLAEPEARPWALLVSAWIASEADDRYLARVWLDRHAATFPEGPGHDWRDAMQLETAIRHGDHPAALASLARLPVDAPELADRLARRPRRRSPMVGGLLSAVVPGLGQLVAGQPVEALSALVVNGGLFAGTVTAARRGATEGAIALGVVAFGFYTGNVYGGADAALRFNRAQQRRLLEMVSREGLSPGLPPLPDQR